MIAILAIALNLSLACLLILHFISFVCYAGTSQNVEFYKLQTNRGFFLASVGVLALIATISAAFSLKIQVTCQKCQTPVISYRWEEPQKEEK